MNIIEFRSETIASDVVGRFAGFGRTGLKYPRLCMGNYGDSFPKDWRLLGLKQLDVGRGSKGSLVLILFEEPFSVV